MIQEAYVTFEVAELLKEKGFDEPCGMFYNEHFKSPYSGTLTKNSQTISCTAPTHQMAMAWLREKGLYIYVQPTKYVGGALYGFQAVIEDEKNNWEKHIFHSESYNEAVEVALRYTLENLV